MKRAIAIVTLISVAGLATANASEVPDLPNCGGNAQGVGVNPTVPWTCGNAKSIPGITGGLVVGRLTLKQTANGTGQVVVEVTLPEPQTFDVALVGKWHIGKSSGPLTAQALGTIPAGQTTATVVTGRSDICDGQFDFKVNGTAPANRLHGPWLTITTCQVTPPTTIPPTVQTIPPGTLPPSL